jgi:hypothetical protein
MTTPVKADLKKKRFMRDSLMLLTLASQADHLMVKSRLTRLPDKSRATSNVRLSDLPGLDDVVRR